MKKFMFCSMLFFFFTSTVFASEYNVPLWQNDKDTSTFVSMLNGTYKSVVVEITLKDHAGSIVYNETQIIEGGKAWFFDTTSKLFEGYGTMNIFIEDSVKSQVLMAITALLYGQYNIAVQVWKY